MRQMSPEKTAVASRRQNKIAEHGPFAKFERAVAEQNLAVGNIGRQQIGRELDAAEIRAQILRQAFDRTCLREAGQSFEQNVAVGEQRYDDALDHAVLPDYIPADPRLQIGDRGPGRRALWSSGRVGRARQVSRITQRNPTWLVEVSIGSAWRAAGR